MTGEQTANAAAGGVAAATSGWLSIVGETAMQLLGVPVPVVVASLAGTLLARVYLPPLAFGAALLRSFAWLLVGCTGAQGVSALVSAASSLAVPVGYLGIFAMFLSGLGPKLWPVLVQHAPLILGRWLSKFGGSDGK